MDILSLIGKTPVLYLKHISQEVGAHIYVKAEMFNPGGSIKDRVSYAYIKHALEQNLITQESTVVEASSGNLGIGLALVCKQFGLRLKICMPESASIERRKLIGGLGAELELTPATKGMSGAIEKVDELLRDNADMYQPHQFKNTLGPQTHYHNLGVEIAEYARAHDMQWAAFVSGVGSGATFSGVSKRLREIDSAIYTCPVEPTESPVIAGGTAGAHGIQGIGAGFIPPVLDTSLISEVLSVSTKDAVNCAKMLLAKEGLNAGISTGANVFASMQLAKRSEFTGKNIITIACDTGERYMTTALFE